MQVRQWVDVAAEQQGRDPARLAPLKPLPDCLVVRELEKPVFGEGGLEFAGGLLGVGQKVSPGNYGPDMNKVKQLCVDVGGYGAKELFEMNFLGQGFRSYVLAEDTRTGEVVGCAQLTRVQVGGYLYLTDDLQIDRVFVKEEYRRIGLANHMINALLQRVKPSQRAWMFADKDTPALRECRGHIHFGQHRAASHCHADRLRPCPGDSGCEGRTASIWVPRGCIVHGGKQG